MTSDNNKPSWQYVPPTSPTEGSSIDATRYMKGGSPRRKETQVDNTVADLNDNKKSAETQNTSESAQTSSSVQTSEISSLPSYETEAAPESSTYTPSSESSESPRTHGRRRFERSDRENGRSFNRYEKNEAEVSSNKGSEKLQGFWSSVKSFFKKLAGKKIETKTGNSFDREHQGGRSGDFRGHGRRRFNNGRRGGYSRGGRRGGYNRGRR